jgi:IclR family pca regulon transcriptional regulator
MDLKNVAFPYLEELARISEQNVNLAILDHTEIVVIERIKKWQILDINIQIGGRLSIYQSSPGRAILAFLNEEKFESIFNALLKDPKALPHIGVNGTKLIKKLKEARLRGYVLNDEEYFKGLRSIAAPIFNAQSDVEGAVYMSVFSQMVSREELVKHYVPMLMDTARKISAARGQPSEGVAYSGATPTRGSLNFNRAPKRASSSR